MAVSDVMAAMAGELPPHGPGDEVYAEDVIAWLEAAVVTTWNLYGLDPAKRPVLAAPAWVTARDHLERMVQEHAGAVVDEDEAAEAVSSAYPLAAVPSTTSSPAVENRRRYTAIEKEAAVLAGRRDGPAKACRDLGVSSTSLLRHWSKQYDEAGGIPPTWLRDGKPGPASTSDTARAARYRDPDRDRVRDLTAAEKAAKLERAAFVDQLPDTEREVLAAALEREGVDLASVEAEAGPTFPKVGPIERRPVVESRARDAAAEALYQDQ